jgi:hypothetical protein
MASASATEQPTLNRAWEAVLAHVPTILLIWLATAVLAVLGAAVTWLFLLVGFGVSGSTGSDSALSIATLLGQLGQLPFAILSSLVGVLFVAVPAMHYASGEVITVVAAFRELLRRPGRYLLAGLLFSLVAAVGFVLCIVPGILVALVMPIYVNRIFLTDQPIPDAFAASFQAVYRSPNGGSFILIEILAWLSGGAGVGLQLRPRGAAGGAGEQLLSAERCVSQGSDLLSS